MGINKVEYGGNVLIDLTDLDVTAGDVVSGVTFIMRDGTKAVGAITVPTKTSELLNDSNFISADNSGNVSLTGNISLDGHTDPLGWYDAHSNTTSVSSGSSYTGVSASDISLTAGRYAVFASVSWASNTSGVRGISIGTTSSTYDLASASQTAVSLSGWTTKQTTSTFLNLTSNTTVRLWLLQSSGSSLSATWNFYAIRIR